MNQTALLHAADRTQTHGTVMAARFATAQIGGPLRRGCSLHTSDPLLRGLVARALETTAGGPSSLRPERTCLRCGFLRFLLPDTLAPFRNVLPSFKLACNVIERSISQIGEQSCDRGLPRRSSTGSLRI